MIENMKLSYYILNTNLDLIKYSSINSTFLNIDNF